MSVKTQNLAEEIEWQRERARQYKKTGKPLLWDYDELLQYAEGDIAPVFNKYLSGTHPPWSVIDTYPIRVRLPQREYLLVSRVTKMEATTNVYGPCSMTTEYDIPINGSLSEGGDVPWAVLVESGQCDLMLISYLGIDFQNEGVRSYRLLDTTLTFYGVAHEGETLVYDIKLNNYAKKDGKVSMMFFSYNCYVNGKLLIEMRNGVAGFFTKEELAAGKGVVHTGMDRKAREKIVKQDIQPFMFDDSCAKTSFSEEDMIYLSHKGQEGWGPILPNARDVKYKLCAKKMLMIDRITHVLPSGGGYGLGVIVGEKNLERDHWYFPCHFKNDEVMAGSLVSDGCSQMLKVYMIQLGLHNVVQDLVFRPVNGCNNKVRCRGQISPHKGKLVYIMEIRELGFNKETGAPYAVANVDIIDVDYEKGQTFSYDDYPLYGKGDLSRKIVVDFKGIALQIESPPNHRHPTMPSAVVASSGPVLGPSAVNKSTLPDVLLRLDEPFTFGDAIVYACEPKSLGDKKFMKNYGVDYPLYTGAMAKGIASADLVIAAGKRRMLASLGAGGLPLQVVEKDIKKIQAELPNGPFAVNLIHSPADPLLEEGNVDLFLRLGVRVVEASAFMSLTPAVVRYRLSGLVRDSSCPGGVRCDNKIIFKVSRTELAELAMRPAPSKFVEKLLKEGSITQEQAALSKLVPMADDVAVEADSGGHTDNRPLVVILPLIIATRNRIQKEYQFNPRVRVGAGGGIGCPEAVLAAFNMGAAFVLTGTVNQMSKQAGTCDAVRTCLSKAQYSDITMAPAADMFDQGVELQVLKTNTMFPARAKKLWSLFCHYNSLEELPEREVAKLEKSVFKKTIAEVWAETVSFHIDRLGDHEKIARAEADPKLKMSLCFRWYLGLSSFWANSGVAERKLDYQIWCGPAIGAFNTFIEGSYLDPKVSGGFPCVFQINLQLLMGACYLQRFRMLSDGCDDSVDLTEYEDLFKPVGPA